MRTQRGTGSIRTDEGDPGDEPGSELTIDQQKELVITWNTAGPELERIRRESLRGKAYCYEEVDALLSLGDNLKLPPRTSSGLVEMQRVFMKAHLKEGTE